MNFSLTARLLTALALISWVVSLTSAQSATASRSYRMGTVGNLEMSVPSSWQDNFKTLDKPQGVTLAYRLPSRTDFYMKVTAVWIPPEKRSSVEPEWVRHAVERSARDIAGSSKPLPTLTQISSTGGNGYYFQTPGYDRFPIGEFHYITGGVLDLGGVTFVFTTYTNTNDLPEIDYSLRVVSSARFVSTRLDEERIGFTVPAAPWTLTLPKGELVVETRQLKPDGRSGYFSMNDERNKMTISFFIEPVKDCKDSKTCRDMVWKLGNPSWENPQKVVQSEIGDVSYFEFFMSSFRGMPVDQQNLYAEFVKDGFWVDMHISKVLYKPEEHELFERVIKSVRFEPKEAQGQKEDGLR